LLNLSVEIRLRLYDGSCLLAGNGISDIAGNVQVENKG
jgi:hypothetical protein